MENDDVDGSRTSKPYKIVKKLLSKRETAISSATPDDEYYPLDAGKMGVCLIFNHEEFDYRTDKRVGTDKDKDALERFFKKCDFDVRPYKDKKADEISKILKGVKDENHKNACCFVCCVLTHGDFKFETKTEVLCARDTSYPTENLYTPFLDCHTLVGKPKMFFIQACRGGQPSKAVDILFKHSAGALLPKRKTIGAETYMMWTIPKEADFLIAHSTVPGHLSFKSGKGSWFIQELCKALNKNAEESDLESILTTVRRKVAICYRSHTEKVEYDQKKQIPSLYTTLTRKFKFPSIK